MPNIDTSKVKAIAGEMIDINNRYRDDFSAVEQAINRLKTDWQQPQRVSTAAFACFDEIKAKFFEPSITERRELAQYLCDAVGIGYEEAENTNKKLLEQLFDSGVEKTTLSKSLNNENSLLAFALDPNSLTVFNFSYASTFLAKHKWDTFGSLLFDKAPDLVRDLFMGKDYNQQIMINELSALLAKMDSEMSPDKVPEEIKIFLKSSEALGKWDENSDFYKKYKYFFENKEFFNDIGKVQELLKYGEKGIEALQYIFTNYDFEIQQLEILKGTCTDADFEFAVDFLIKQYTNKFLGSLDNVSDFAVSELIDGFSSEMLKAATGGLYSIVDLGREVLSWASGISHHADGMQGILAASNVNNEIVRSFDTYLRKIRSGEYVESDLVNFEKTFNLAKASTLDLYEKMYEFSDSSSERSFLSIEINKIKKLECHKLDQSTNFIANGGGGRF